MIFNYLFKDLLSLNLVRYGWFAILKAHSIQTKIDFFLIYSLATLLLSLANYLQLIVSVILIH